MEVIHARCAGIDVSKKDAKVCVRVQGSGRRATSTTVTTWGSMTSDILALREHLLAEQVSCVVIESTSAYWKPFYYLLEDALDVMLVNARAARNVPGRKTDVSDAAWLADLGAHGLIRASFVPPEPIRVLRDLTRARTIVAQARVKEIQRLEKLLEDAGIKLSSVATDIVGVSGRSMLEALIAGHGSIRCLLEMTDFQGIELRALWDEIKFDVRHSRQVERSAVIGDRKWEAWMTRLSWPIFPKAELRYFDSAEREHAWDWITQEV